MSALVLGKRSTSCFFEELHHHPPTGSAPTPSPQPSSSSSKRARFGASPHPFPAPQPCGPSPPPSPAWDGAAGVHSNRGDPTLLDHLRSIFPDMEEQLLERALEASANDLDSAIRSLKELRLGSMEGSLQSSVHDPVEGIDADILHNTSGVGSSENSCAMSNLPADGSEWVELLVREMMKSTDVNDARVRASRLLEVLEKSIMTRASAEVAQTFHKENEILREQLEGLLHDNNILKKAVAIQHERQKEFDERNQELQHLKQLVVQYQEQLRTLEINNYALSMHLRQAQQGSSIPGRFHPDVF
uniref:Filament-like plant protein 4 n=1 Tax=Anthurium amnicola TaxID=1678845 RepID=A0A1D1XDD8_9ARAE